MIKMYNYNILNIEKKFLRLNGLSNNKKLSVDDLKIDKKKKFYEIIKNNVLSQNNIFDKKIKELSIIHKINYKNMKKKLLNYVINRLCI